MNGTANLEDLTVADLFALSPENAGKLGVKLKPDDFKDVEAQAKALAQPVAWSEMRTKLAGTIADALNVSVLDGWAAAWQKWKLVKEKVEESRRNPTAEVPCELFEHTIESTLHPYLEVLMGQTPVQRVDFDVTLSTEIDSVRLNLKNGNLVSLQPGACVWSGSVALHGAELLHQPLAQLDLPGSVVLKEPIPLYAQEKAVEGRVDAGNGKKSTQGT
jgi:hypothetical protein